MPGKPGVVCVEGFEDDVKEFVSSIRVHAVLLGFIHHELSCVANGFCCSRHSQRLSWQKMSSKLQQRVPAPSASDAAKAAAGGSSSSSRGSSGPAAVAPVSAGAFLAAQRRFRDFREAAVGDGAIPVLPARRCPRPISLLCFDGRR